MKSYSFLFLFSSISLISAAQQNFTYKREEDKFYLAKEYFQKGQYNLAYPLLKELQQSLSESERVNNQVRSQEVDYYATVAALKQNESRAELDAKQYIDIVKNNARVQMMNYHLAEYYFRKQQYSDAVDL
ncbi:MAG: hypothetical protein ICV81_14320, partial [Flavisolibacter sp.]|nr:hypothetical protein [Flavisolibacter sp.]